MRKHVCAALVVICVAAVCSASPADARLSRLLVGEWQGGRHAVDYRADGTWRFCPLAGTTHGKWRIEAGRLIKTWRFLGESEDSSTVDQIVELTRQRLRIRTLAQDGPGRPAALTLPSGVYTLKRIPAGAHSHE
jgi:hypothetical protein